MANYRFDDQNFLVIEKIKVAKIAVDVIDNRTNAETTLHILINMDDFVDYRDKVKQICRDLGYSVVLIGEPMTLAIDSENIVSYCTPPEI